MLSNTNWKTTPCRSLEELIKSGEVLLSKSGTEINLNFETHEAAMNAFDQLAGCTEGEPVEQTNWEVP